MTAMHNGHIAFPQNMTTRTSKEVSTLRRRSSWPALCRHGNRSRFLLVWKLPPGAEAALRERAADLCLLFVAQATVEVSRSPVLNESAPGLPRDGKTQNLSLNVIWHGWHAVFKRNMQPSDGS